MDANFSGGIVADLPESESLFLSAFWLGRCNASLPPIYFTGIDSGLIFHICKSGNLHVECYGEDEMNDLQKFSNQLGFS